MTATNKWDYLRHAPGARQQSNGVRVGDSVTIRIAEPARWKPAALAAINKETGMVRAILPDAKKVNFLVEFDYPVICTEPNKAGLNERQVRAAWFDRADLVGGRDTPESEGI